jgi:hypothetical protein
VVERVGGQEFMMSIRSLTLAAVLALAPVLAIAPARGQTRTKAAPQWTAPRTPDGQPDIQGTWNSIESFFTPLQRPAAVAGKEQISEAELKAVLEEEADRKLDAADRGVGAYGHEWYEYNRNHVGSAASLIVEPADGRLPAMTPWAKEKTAFMRTHWGDSYEYIDPGDRCISRGILGMMLPTFYNNGKIIVQSPGYVTIVSEMIHDARIIPLDGRPHAPANIRSWAGDARGHWDGSTLVVDTTNFSPHDVLRNIGIQTENLHMVERFTRVDRDTLKYQVTIDDPKVYTAPWTIAFPFKQANDYQMFEYGCHEGNYAVPGMLRGARAEEKAASK